MDSKHQFKRILHKPRMEQSFFGSPSFVRNDTVFQYGGYGNFSYKNDLIFVDSNLGTWEYYPYTQKNKLKPSAGTPQYYTFFDSKLIIAVFYLRKINLIDKVNQRSHGCSRLFLYFREAKKQAPWLNEPKREPRPFSWLH